MVSVLYRLKKQVKHIHSAQHFLKVSPEDKATQTIIILICTFVITYFAPSICLSFRISYKLPILWRESVFLSLETCFPIVFAFVLTSNIKSITNFFFPAVISDSSL